MLVNVPISRITANPWQTRVGEPDPEYIKELAMDIAEHGLLQTPMGRVFGFGHGIELEEGIGQDYILGKLDGLPTYSIQLAFGHNRLAAFRWLYDLRNNSDIKGDYSSIPVDLKTLSDEQMAVLAWSENERRRDVTAIERARAIQQRLDTLGWTNRQCAEQLGLDHSTVSNLLRLLKLPEDLQTAILEGKISSRQAEALLPIYEAPVVYEDTVPAKPGSYGYARGAKELIKAMLAGESSDYTREQVKRYFEQASNDLEKAEFELNTWFQEDNRIYCAVCRTCDKRMGSRNRCFDHSCFVAKTEAHRMEYLVEASEKTGWPIKDMEKGGDTTSLMYHGKGVAEKIIATKCQNLVLEYCEQVTTPGNPDHVQGWPHVRLVCDKRNHSCTCLKGFDELRSLGSKDAPEPAAVTSGQLEEAARAARKAKTKLAEKEAEVRGRMVKYIRELMAINNVGAWYAAMHGTNRVSYRAFDLDAIFDHIAKTAVNNIMGMEGPGSPNYSSEELMMQVINRRLEELEIPPLPAENGLFVPLEMDAFPKL